MENKKKKIFWLILCIFFTVTAICAGFVIFKITHGTKYDFGKYKNDDSATLQTASTDEDSTSGTDTSAETEDPKANLPDNPIDFDALYLENPDIYAWIQVPGTLIDYPIVQSESSANYYFRRDYKGNPDVCGCIFTQYFNKKDFTDPNTVIYGHYMYDKSFFGGLHEYRDEQFLYEHPDIYIYIPGHKLTYEIFAAYEYDDRHILKSFDFSDEEVYAQYLEECLNPLTVARTVKQGITLTTEDRIVTLSTCVASGADSLRYLVQGVLRSDEPTK